MRWKWNCRKRDAYTCQLCGKQHGKYSRRLHVHHKAPFVSYPSLRSEPLNGVTLCAHCHNASDNCVHSNAGREQREAWEQEALAELWHLLTDEERERAGQTIRNHQPTLQEVAEHA